MVQPGMQAGDNDENPLCSSNTSAEDTDMVKAVVQSSKESYKIKIMDLLKPISKNPEHHPMARDGILGY